MTAGIKEREIMRTVQNLRKRILACLLAVVMAFAMLPAVAFAADPTVYNVANFTQLQAARNSYTSATSDVVINITGDFDLTGALNIFTPATAGVTLTIKSDSTTPYTLTRGATGSLFNVSQGAVVIFENIIIDGARGGAFPSDGGGQLVSVGGSESESGSFTMNDGAVLRNNISNTSGGASVSVIEGGTFTMNGGQIINNSTNSSGGGVRVRNSTFIMNGGLISNNNSNYGGGVGVENSSTFTMNSGQINNNSASLSGGGVHVSSGATFNLGGGQFSNNSAKDWGGAVYNAGTLNASGTSVSMSGNSADTGGHYISVGGTTASINDTSNAGALLVSFMGNGISYAEPGAAHHLYANCTLNGYTVSGPRVDFTVGGAEPISWALAEGLASSPTSGPGQYYAPSTPGLYRISGNVRTTTGLSVKDGYLRVGKTITGPTNMTLTEGYAAESSSAFTLTDTGGVAPTVTLDNSYGGLISWNDATKKLDVAPGLVVGSYPVRLTANNGTPTGLPVGTYDLSTYDFTLTVIPPLAPTITTSALPGGTVGTTYSQTLAATGTMPITWSIDSGSGALPAGLTLSSDGVISGTPTAAGTATFTAKATNVVGDNTQALSINISSPVFNGDSTKAPTKLKVKFNANGGKVGKAKTKSVKVTKGKAIGKLPKVAKRAKYTFKGWYTAKGGGTKVTSKTKVKKNITLYAHWKAKTKYGKVINATAVYVRKAPSSHASSQFVVGHLKKGQTFKVQGFINKKGTNKDWYRLTYQGRTAYVYAKYVKVVYK